MNGSKFWYFIIVLVSFSLKVNGAEYSLFEPVEGATAIKESKRRHDYYQLVVGVESKEFITKQISGKVVKLAMKVKGQNSAASIFASYQAQLEKLNATHFFQCSGKSQCGSPSKLNRIIKPIHSRSQYSPYLLTAVISIKGVNTYVSIWIAELSKQSFVQVDIISEKDLSVGLVTVNPHYKSALSQPVELEVFKGSDKKGSQDHPMISRMPGSKIGTYRALGFSKNKLVSSINQRDYEFEEANGKTLVIGYKIPRQYSELEVFENYRKALLDLNFTIVTECQATECGSNNKFRKALQPDNYVKNDKGQQYLLAKQSGNEGLIWVSIYVTGHSTLLKANVHIVEQSELNNRQLAIDENAIRQSIESKGFARLDGLLFEYDSDELLEQSNDVLSEIARYLNKNKNSKFYVVGHTDDSGKQKYNLQLSARRANTVANQLINDFSVTPTQLEAIGMGEYAPAASNLSVEGREQNRRVNLVLRSDNK